jgi:hypothetical protein
VFSSHKLARRTLCNILSNIHFHAANENQQAPLKDPLHVPVGPITTTRSKKIKEAYNGLIQEIWGDSKMGHSKLGPNEDESVINLIQPIDGRNFLSICLD